MMKKKESGMYHGACDVTFVFMPVLLHSWPKSNLSHCLSLQGTASRLQLTIYYTINFYYQSTSSYNEARPLEPES